MTEKTTDKILTPPPHTEPVVFTRDQLDWLPWLEPMAEVADQAPRNDGNDGSSDS